MLRPSPAQPPVAHGSQPRGPGSGMRGRVVGGDGLEHVGGVSVARGVMGCWISSSVGGPGQLSPLPAYPTLQVSV